MAMTLWRLSGYFQGFDSRNIIESTFSSKVSMSLSLSWSLVRSFQDIPVYRHWCYSICDEIHRRISDFQKWERSPNFPPKVPMSNRVLVLAWEFLHYSKLRRKNFICPLSYLKMFNDAFVVIINKALIFWVGPTVRIFLLLKTLIFLIYRIFWWQLGFFLD